MGVQPPVRDYPIERGSIFTRIADRHVTILWTGNPSLTEGSAQSFIGTPLMFFTTIRAFHKGWVFVESLSADVMIALVGVAMLTEVPPHLFFERVAVHAFDRRVVLGQYAANWCIEMVVPGPHDRGLLAALPALCPPRQQFFTVNWEIIGQHDFRTYSRTGFDSLRPPIERWSLTN